MEKWGAKTVVLEHEVAAKADQAKKDYSRFDEAFMGLQWHLAHSQNVGMSRIRSINGERVYVQKGNSLAKAPTIWVLFSDGSDKVYILDINVIPYDDQ